MIWKRLKERKSWYGCLKCNDQRAALGRRWAKMAAYMAVTIRGLDTWLRPLDGYYGATSRALVKGYRTLMLTDLSRVFARQNATMEVSLKPHTMKHMLASPAVLLLL